MEEITAEKGEQLLTFFIVKTFGMECSILCNCYISGCNVVLIINININQSLFRLYYSMVCV